MGTGRWIGVPTVRMTIRSRPVPVDRGCRSRRPRPSIWGPPVAARQPAVAARRARRPRPARRRFPTRRPRPRRPATVPHRPGGQPTLRRSPRPIRPIRPRSRPRPAFPDRPRPARALHDLPVLAPALALPPASVALHPAPVSRPGAAVRAAQVAHLDRRARRRLRRCARPPGPQPVRFRRMVDPDRVPAQPLGRHPDQG
jgi:hypothetical protein